MLGHRVVDTVSLTGEITSVPGGIAVNGTHVPLEDVAVLLLGLDMSISGGALNHLARYEVVVLNCDWRGVPDMVAYGWSRNSRVAKRHQAQAELSRPRRKAAWKAIVQAKVGGQASNLGALQESGAADVLSELRRLVRSGDPENIEAQAARFYWPSLFGDPGFRRRHDEGDNTNALLNYGYAVVRGFLIQAIGASGLCPTLGVFHRNRANPFVLADDLMEPYRPAVDFTVATMSPAATLDSRPAKAALVGVLSQPFGRTGLSLMSSARGLASSLAAYCEGTHQRLAVPQWDAPTASAWRRDG